MNVKIIVPSAPSSYRVIGDPHMKPKVMIDYHIKIPGPGSFGVVYENIKSELRNPGVHIPGDFADIGS
jgi:hypothetical protein